MDADVAVSLFPSPIRSPLGEVVQWASEELDAWCTPSILPDIPRLEGLAGEVSVSVDALVAPLQLHRLKVGSALGTPSGDSGIFGAVQRHAAELVGADGARLSTGGSTECLRVALWRVAMEHPAGLVLIASDCHHATINSIRQFGLTWARIPTRAIPGFEGPLPVSPVDIADALKKHPNVVAVVWVSPTYEGLCAHQDKLVATVRELAPDALIIVDEAWGAHLAFHPALPRHALAAGADIALTSLHKVGGAPQGAALIAWKARANGSLMRQAFAECASTSPPFRLLVAGDISLRTMAAEGKQRIDAAAARIADVESSLATALPDIRVLTANDLPQERVAGLCPLRLTIGTAEGGPHGQTVKRRLLAKGIVPEKAGDRTVTFLSAFQLRVGAERRLVHALRDVLRQPAQRRQLAPTPPDPYIDLPLEPIASMKAVARSRDRVVNCPVERAVGMVAAAPVEIYPPGVPLLIEGCEITEAVVAHLIAAYASGANVVDHAEMPRCLRVIHPGHLLKGA